MIHAQESAGGIVLHARCPPARMAHLDGAPLGIALDAANLSIKACLLDRIPARIQLEAVSLAGFIHDRRDLVLGVALPQNLQAGLLTLDYLVVAGVAEADVARRALRVNQVPL